MHCELRRLHFLPQDGRSGLTVSQITLREYLTRKIFDKMFAQLRRGQFNFE